MQVNLSFDTEKESLENLQKLVDALNQLISSRGGNPHQNLANVATSMSSQPQKPVPDKTTGGCRVIPYEDMSGKMTSIFSGRRI
jgi:hypothetical protein